MKSCVLSTEGCQVLLGISDVAVQSGKRGDVVEGKKKRGVAGDGREGGMYGEGGVGGREGEPQK